MTIIDIDEIDKLVKRDIVIFTCENCFKETSKSVNALRKNRRFLCKSCLMLEKYGSTSNIGRESSKEKSKNTKNRKYGSVSNCQKNAYEKAKNTFLDKYGVDNPSKSEEVKNKIKETLSNNFGSIENFYEYSKEKSKITCLERYDNETYFNSKECLEKTKEKLGVEYALQDKNIHHKTIINCDTSKRVENIRKNSKNENNWVTSNIEKQKNTNLERYGFEWYQQSPSYQNTAKKKYFYDNQYFDSSWELAFYIKNIDDGIQIKRCDTPFLMSNNKYIYIDFLVNDKLVEIKGDHFKKHDNWKYKEEFYKNNNIKVLFYEDIKPYLEYVKNKYGKDYLKSFKFFKKNYFN